MWFLLLQIFLLMLLAALFGAALAWWWMKNRYEDVTETYEAILGQGPNGNGKEKIVTREDLEAQVAGLSDRLASLPQPDLSPLHERLGTIEARILESRSSVEPVMERLAAVEAALGEMRSTGFEPVEDRLARIEDRVNAISEAEPPEFPEIPAVDLGPVHSGLARLELALENLDLPITDLDPLRSDLSQMESRLAEFAERLDAQRKSDSESMTIRMQTLSSSLAAMRLPDVDGLKERLTRLEAAIAKLPDTAPDLGPVTETIRQIEAQMRLPSDDFRVMHNKLSDLEGGTAALHSKLAQLENHVAAMERSQVDLSPLQGRLANMEAALSALRLDLQALPDIGPLERRLAALQESVISRDPDLAGLTNSMRKMESRLNLGAMEDRLSAIEYGLAAVQHMLRTRQEATWTRPVEPDFAYRQPAPPPSYETRPATTYIVPAEPESPPPLTPQPAQAAPAAPAPDPTPQPRPQPAAPADPLASARRPDDKANLLTDAAFGEADDLEMINGIGPMLCELLNEVGVYYFWQIAEWGPDEIEWVDDKLQHFKGRIQRDDWVGQARALAQKPGVARKPRNT